MEIIELRERGNVAADVKIRKIYAEFQALLNELSKRNLPDKTIEVINENIEELNAISFLGNRLKSLLLKKQRQIIKLVERKHKIVPKNYYRRLWLVLGMFVFGIPIGLALGAGNRNMGSIAIGLPIGLAIGLAVGSEMDNKAFKEGRQLQIELSLPGV